MASGASRRGDADVNLVVELTDAVRILTALFFGTGRLDCEDAADANDDGEVDLSDAIKILVVLFLGGAAIPPPGMSFCGPDPTPDRLPICLYGADC